MTGARVDRNIAGEGSKEAFREKWLSLNPLERKFYTRGRPATQKEWIFRRYYQFIERRLAERPGGLLCLEVGAGRGTTSLYLTQAGHWSVLVDSGIEALEMARANFDSEGLKATFVQSTAENLGIGNASVDVVISLGLLEHFADVRPPLGEMARVLRPGGSLFSLNIPVKAVSANLLAQPYNFVLVQAKRLVHFRRSLARWRHGARPGVYRNRLSPAEYRQAALAVGFREAWCLGVNPFPTFHPLPRWLDRTLTRGYERVLAIRSYLLAGEPFITSFLWGREHFLVARK